MFWITDDASQKGTALQSIHVPSVYVFESHLCVYCIAYEMMMVKGSHYNGKHTQRKNERRKNEIEFARCVCVCVCAMCLSAVAWYAIDKERIWS